MSSYKQEVVVDFLVKAMEIERKYSYEKSGADTSRIEELYKLVDNFCTKVVDRENN